MSHHSQLPDEAESSFDAAAVIERIWKRLTVRYGHQFLSKWEGLDMRLAKQDWLNELQSAILRRPESAAFALENLPVAPPDVKTFRALMHSMPEQTTIALPNNAPKRVPKVAKYLAERLHNISPDEPPQRVRAAQALVRKYEGRHVPGYARTNYRLALEDIQKWEAQQAAAQRHREENEATRAQ